MQMYCLVDVSPKTRVLTLLTVIWTLPTCILAKSFFSQFPFLYRVQFRTFPRQPSPLETIQLYLHSFLNRLASVTVCLLHDLKVELLDDFLVQCNHDFGFHNIVLLI